MQCRNQGFCSLATLQENIIMRKILSIWYHFTFSCIHTGSFHGRMLIFQLVQPKAGVCLPTKSDMQITFWPYMKVPTIIRKGSNFPLEKGLCVAFLFS